MACKKVFVARIWKGQKKKKKAVLEEEEGCEVERWVVKEEVDREGGVPWDYKQVVGEGEMKVRWMMGVKEQRLNFSGWLMLTLLLHSKTKPWVEETT